ncbi:MAG: SDR family NAD(P)-dependent oxidoreductase [Chlamydiales bacterium]|nr:SDR family NAD(P)-dependent oxidoreductase [Chlamydiales bacterium]
MKKVLITGASSGIGREIALLLAERSVELIIHGRDLAALAELAQEIGTKTKVTICQAELASYDGSQKVLRALQDSFPDVVINNAGFGLYGDFVNQGPQETQKMIAANCAAVVSICQHIAYWWKQEKVAGTILNVSSALSFMPTPGAAVYAASKAFINSFSQAIDVELEPDGIRVLTACPGRVATNFAGRASKGNVETQEHGGMVLDPKAVAQALIDQIEKRKPLRVINWKYRLLLFVSGFLPERFAMKKLYESLKARAAPK